VHPGNVHPGNIDPGNIDPGNRAEVKIDIPRRGERDS
jgi:hypothetical protein